MELGLPGLFPWLPLEFRPTSGKTEQPGRKEPADRSEAGTDRGAYAVLTCRDVKRGVDSGAYGAIDNLISKGLWKGQMQMSE